MKVAGVFDTSWRRVAGVRYTSFRLTVVSDISLRVIFVRATDEQYSSLRVAELLDFFLSVPIVADVGDTSLSVANFGDSFLRAANVCDTSLTLRVADLWDTSLRSPMCWTHP